VLGKGALKGIVPRGKQREVRRVIGPELGLLWLGGESKGLRKTCQGVRHRGLSVSLAGSFEKGKRTKLLQNEGMAGDVGWGQGSPRESCRS